jgi:hypothetical protein
MLEERSLRKARLAQRALGELGRRRWYSATAAAGTTATATTAAATTTAAGTATPAAASTAAATARTAARAAATPARTTAAAAAIATAAGTAGSSRAHGAAGAVKRLLFGRAERIDCGDDNESQHDYQEGVLGGVLSRVLFPEALDSGQHGNTFDSAGGLTVQLDIKVNW